MKFKTLFLFILTGLCMYIPTDLFNQHVSLLPQFFQTAHAQDSSPSLSQDQLLKQTLIQLINQGQTLYQKKQYQKAIDSFLRAVQVERRLLSKRLITPKEVNPNLHWNLGGLYGKLKQWKKGIKHLDVFISSSEVKDKIKLRAKSVRKTYVDQIEREGIKGEIKKGNKE